MVGDVRVLAALCRHADAIVKPDFMAAHSGRRIVFSTWGSLGDLHPYLPIALALQRQGCSCCMATSNVYREKCLALGLDFAPVGPDLPAIDDTVAMHRLAVDLMDPKVGLSRIINDMILSHIRHFYRDLLQAARGADLLVTHPLPLVGPVVAEHLRLPWVSTVLAPMSFFSVYDPPVGTGGPWVGRIARMCPWLSRLFVGAVKMGTERWMQPVYALRQELGLVRGKHPLFDGQHAPSAVLALFSEVLAAPQRDWPAVTEVTGFCFYDQRGFPGDAQTLSPGLRNFLDSGVPPIVFTLGSAAVWDPRDYFEVAIAWAKSTQRRVVLLVGSDAEAERLTTVPAIFATAYAPFSELFPRAEAVVHQGGIGTTGQVLRAGVPSLVVPHAHDQFDNGMRLHRLGVAEVLSRSRYAVAEVQTQLAALSNATTRATARAVSARVRAENGVQHASNVLMAVLNANQATR